MGEGGMGVVLRARHRYTGATVALKMVHPHLEGIREHATRFLAEARAPAAIGHPGIVAVTDAGIAPEGDLYLAMELLRGETLGARLRRGPLPLAEVVRIGVDVLDALGAAHTAGFVHRDLKPDNVFLTEPDGRAKLLDFGIAKVASELGGDAAGRTATGAMMGTVAYMSPEQLRDSANVDGRTDLWAMGVTVYQMATGVLPYDGRSAPEIVVSIMSRPPRPIAEVTPHAPAALGSFVTRALARQPWERFGSAAEMADALRALVPGAVSLPAAPASAARGSFAPSPRSAAPPPWQPPPSAQQPTYGPQPFAPAPVTTGAGAVFAPAPAPSRGGGGAGPWLGLGLAGCLGVGVLVVGVAAAGVLFALRRRPAAADVPACRGDACYHLGLRFEQGSGVAKDHFKAVALYQRSCNDGSMLGCNALGNSYRNGFGGLDRDYGKARALYERVCDAGMMEGCHNLGVIYSNGLGVPVDKARARAYFQKSCRGGNGASCELAK